MAVTVCEMLLLKKLLSNFNISDKESMILYCHSKAAIYINNNPIYNEHTKYIVDFHFLREKMQGGIINTSHRSGKWQQANILTKAVNRYTLESKQRHIGKTPNQVEIVRTILFNLRGTTT